MLQWVKPAMLCFSEQWAKFLNRHPTRCRLSVTLALAGNRVSSFFAQQSCLWFCLLLGFAAGFCLQDIAVDGWALTLLPPHHIEYASTCQTLGMNCGYFTSFTIFLALSNPEFCNAYIRGNKRLSGKPFTSRLTVGRLTVGRLRQSEAVQAAGRSGCRPSCQSTPQQQ
jgi:hypothetical protein